MATVATPVPTPNDGLAPEKRRSIERQVYEQEYGTGSYAAATANGKLPNPSTPATLSRAVTSRADMRTMVARHIDSNATLADVRREDELDCAVLQHVRIEVVALGPVRRAFNIPLRT